MIKKPRPAPKGDKAGIFGVHKSPPLATAALMTAGGIGSADAASLPHRIIGRSASEQVQEVTISNARQAAALRFWTPRRMAAVDSPGRAALDRLTYKGDRAAQPPYG